MSIETDITDLQGELQRLKQQVAEMKAREDLWQAQGLQDLFSQHGNQTFSEGNIRLDQVGIQIREQSKSPTTAVYGVEEFSQSPWTETLATRLDMHNIGDSNAVTQIAGWRGADWNSGTSRPDAYANVLIYVDATAWAARLTAVSSGTNDDARVTVWNSTTDQDTYVQIEPSLVLKPRADDTVFLTDGSIWYRSDLDVFRVYINGAVYDLATGPASSTLTHVNVTATEPTYAKTFMFMGA